jgi:hypothetical protein
MKDKELVKKIPAQHRLGNILPLCGWLRKDRTVRREGSLGKRTGEGVRDVLKGDELPAACE